MITTTKDKRIVDIPINQLNPTTYNPRVWDEKSIKNLKKSLNVFGMVDPIIANSCPERKNVVIGGHFRLHVAKLLGWKTVPVTYVNISDIEKEKELNIRLNKNIGDWDWHLLAQFDEDLLKNIGFKSEELDKIFDTAIVEEDDFDAEKEYASIGIARTKPGEIIELGEHRLYCGDSTDEHAADILLDGQKARLIFTDPPYNVDYDYESKYKVRAKRKKKLSGLVGTKIFNDNKSPEEFCQMLTAAFRNYYNHSTDDAAIYICYATKTQEQFFDAFRDAGWHFSQTIIWLKDRIILALGQDYHRIYEPIIFGWKEGKSHYSNYTIATESEFWTLDRQKFEEQLDIWYQKRDKSKDYLHPTQRPVRLAERAIKKSSQRGDIVLDFFGGSGSTLLACEQLGRRCYTIELDPIYCDVIRKRYENYVANKKNENKKINNTKKLIYDYKKRAF